MAMRKLWQRLTRSRASTASWATVSMISEPVELVVAFAAYHLELGASEVLIYFDDPEDPAADALETCANVRVIRCDETLWQSLGGRPDQRNIRQRMLLPHARRQLDVDWFTHIDADEYVVFDRDPGQMLARVPVEEDTWVHAEVAERVWIDRYQPAPFLGGAFRTPLADRDETETVYGTAQEHILPRGTAGHHAGKPFLPTSTPHMIDIHFPFRSNGDRIPASKVSGVHVLHFDAFSPVHFAYKMLRNARNVFNHTKSGRKFRHLVFLDIIAAPDPTRRVFDWFENTYVLPRATADELRGRGALFDHTVDPVAAMRKWFPDVEVDLSATVIDRICQPEVDRLHAEIMDFKRAGVEPPAYTDIKTPNRVEVLQEIQRRSAQTQE